MTASAAAAPAPGQRDRWLASRDDQLLADCDVHRYRASGPGGQHRNKTESAVRLRHRPSGITAIAEDSRAQPENKARALRRLREKLAVGLREPVDLPAFAATPSLAALLGGGTARLGEKTRQTPAYLIGMAQLLDVFVATGAEVAATAAAVGLTTGATSKLLMHDERFAAAANAARAERGLRPLR
ncbi:MAG: peptide chain release factor-like protein [Kofleriaceae bacterium]